jgi:hypothetical protein
MAKFLSWLLIILAMSSCYHSAPDPAYNMSLVLPADTMVVLLTDIHLADGVINTIKEKNKSVKPLATEYFEAVLKKHAVDRSVFEESMRYYAFHTEELNKIYEQVIIELSKKESMTLSTKDTLAEID